MYKEIKTPMEIKSENAELAWNMYDHVHWRIKAREWFETLFRFLHDESDKKTIYKFDSSG